MGLNKSGDEVIISREKLEKLEADALAFRDETRNRTETIWMKYASHWGYSYEKLIYGGKDEIVGELTSRLNEVLKIKEEQHTKVRSLIDAVAKIPKFILKLYKVEVEDNI